MKTRITIVLIFAIFVVVYLFYSIETTSTDTKRASSDTQISESATQTENLQDHSTTIYSTLPDSYTPPKLEPEIEQAIRELVNTSHEGLVEEKTENGIVVDLKGRFRTAPVATIDENGQIVIQDYTSLPGR